MLHLIKLCFFIEALFTTSSVKWILWYLIASLTHHNVLFYYVSQFFFLMLRICWFFMVENKRLQGLRQWCIMYYGETVIGCIHTTHIEVPIQGNPIMCLSLLPAVVFTRARMLVLHCLRKFKTFSFVDSTITELMYLVLIINISDTATHSCTLPLRVIIQILLVIVLTFPYFFKHPFTFSLFQIC